MQHLAFYRKYRPTKFSEVIGQEHIIITLKNSVKNNMVGNAYIFAGPKGTGKTTVAKIFAKAINCTNCENGDCCNQCQNCLEIINQTTTDVLELDAASNNGIDEIRRIVNNVKYMPSSLKKKVYIIDEAHMLTTQAWNAMLKTLEESPEHSVFIFSTTEMHKIPSTIVSRCQYFIFNKLNEKQIKQTIENITNNENVKIDEEAKKILISLANGHARDALSMLEQVSMLTNKDITAVDVNKVFGLVTFEAMIHFINVIIKHNLNEALEEFNKYYESGINVEIFFTNVLSILLDVLVYKQTDNHTLLKSLNKQNISLINIDISHLNELINIINDNLYKIRKDDNVRFCCAQLIIKACNIFADHNIVQEVQHIEKKETTTEPIKSKQTENNNDELPDPSEFFVTKEITNDKKTVTPVVSKISNDKLTIDDIINATASNCNSALLKETSNNLEKIKKEGNIDLVAICSANKVLLSSKNSAILLFDDKIDADLLNKKINNIELRKILNNSIGKQMVFIGLTQDDFKNKITSFLGQKNQKYPEIDVKSSQTENAYDIFDELIN